MWIIWFEMEAQKDEHVVKDQNGEQDSWQRQYLCRQKLEEQDGANPNVIYLNWRIPKKSLYLPAIYITATEWIWKKEWRKFVLYFKKES